MLLGLLALGLSDAHAAESDLAPGFTVILPLGVPQLAEGRTRRNQEELFENEGVGSAPRGWVPLGYSDSKLMQVLYASWLCGSEGAIELKD